MKDQPQDSSEIVVFSILRESKCSKCEAELGRRDFLRMEDGKPLCMACADLDHLLYLPRGDAALTRRAKKHSTLSAVVVRFSRSRKRYERQGILVEEEALEKAEQECLSDAEARERLRERGALRRQEEDRQLVESMSEKIRTIFPGCPPDDASAIARHTALRGSGRIGRSAAGRVLEEDALRTAVIAAIRHRYTNYDKLLMRGWDRSSARAEITGQLEKILRAWTK